MKGCSKAVIVIFFTAIAITALVEFFTSQSATNPTESPTPTTSTQPLVPSVTPPATIPTSTPELSSPTVQFPSVIGKTTQSTELITISYSWFYGGEWSWEVEIPLSLYEYYQKLPRPPTENYSIYVTHPLDDLYIDLLVEKIKKAAREEGYTEYQTVEFAAAFVQSLPYTVDSVTTLYDEYPRYPIETLADKGGDCEDTSILLASIIDKLRLPKKSPFVRCDKEY